MLVLLENCFEFLERSGLTHTDTQTETHKAGSLTYEAGSKKDPSI